MTFIYLIGTGIYALIWIVFFVIRKDLRKKIFFSSLLAAPLGLAEFLFIPEYWIPQFQTIPLFQELFLESILFCFFLGGVASITYQVLFKEKTFQAKNVNPYITLIPPILFLTYFLKLSNTNIMFYAFTSMFIGSAIILYHLKKESKKIIISAIINTIIYSTLYFILWYTFPELPASYQFQNLSGLLLGGIPIEEFLWIFSFTLYWTPIYEIWKNYFSNNQKETVRMKQSKRNTKKW